MAGAVQSMEEESASEGTADPHQKPEVCTIGGSEGDDPLTWGVRIQNESGREGQSKFGPAGEHSKTDVRVDLESHQSSVAQTDTWMNDNRFIRAALRCGIDVTTLIPQEPLDFFRQVGASGCLCSTVSHAISLLLTSSARGTPRQRPSKGASSDSNLYNLCITQRQVRALGAGTSKKSCYGESRAGECGRCLVYQSSKN